MEYRSIYDSINAIKYTGKNFSEVNNFCGGRLSWDSEEEYWEDNNPPEDLIIHADFDFEETIISGDYIIRLSSDHYVVLNEYYFENFFEEAK